MNTALDIAAAAFMLAGSLLALTAAVGLLRFGDVLSRMHAATKPQTLGILMIMTAIILHFRTWHTLALGLLVIVFQLVTAPVAAHMVARGAYHSGAADRSLLSRDELSDR